MDEVDIHLSSEAWACESSRDNVSFQQGASQRHKINGVVPAHEAFEPTRCCTLTHVVTRQRINKQTLPSTSAALCRQLRNGRQHLTKSRNKWAVKAGPLTCQHVTLKTSFVRLGGCTFRGIGFPLWTQNDPTTVWTESNTFKRQLDVKLEAAQRAGAGKSRRKTYFTGRTPDSLCSLT